MKKDNNMYVVLSSPYQYFPKQNKNEEWPGGKPQKFSGGIKTFEKMFFSSSNERPFLQSKIHSLPPVSREYKYIPHMKKVQPFPPRTTLLRRYTTPLYSIKPEKTRKNLAYLIKPKQERICSLGIVPKTTKMVSSEEFTVEDMMARKKRMCLRMNANVKRYGVEYEPDFFKKGGLIPGSTNKKNDRYNKSPIKDSIYDTMDITKKLLDPTKKWRNKSMDNILKQDISYVSNLESIDKEYYEGYINKSNKNTKIRNVASFKRKKEEYNKKNSK